MTSIPETQMITSATLTAGIRHHHEHATAAASSAVSHAIEAGRLLHEAKVSIAHGDFAEWVERECEFTYRTARRYMLASKRLGHLPPANWPSTANLDKALAGSAPSKPTTSALARPRWLPEAGRAVECHDGRGRTWYAWTLDYIADDGTKQDTFAGAIVSTEAGEGGVTYEYLKRGIRIDYLAESLRSLGLRNPNSAAWIEIDAIVPESLHRTLRDTDRRTEAIQS